MLSAAHKYMNLIHTHFACAERPLGICSASFSAYPNIKCVGLIPKDISILNHGSLKSYSHLPKKCVICFFESLLKVMKNAFYFILKVLFVLKICKFL